MVTAKQKRAHAKFVRDLKVMRTRIRAFVASGGSIAGLDRLVEDCLEDLHDDLRLDEWQKDDHPHASRREHPRSGCLIAATA